MAGGQFEIPDFDEPGFKGGGSIGGTPPGGTGGTPPGGTIFGPAGGAGSPFQGIGPSYDRSVPAFGYRRKPLGPVPNSRTAGAASAPISTTNSQYPGNMQGDQGFMQGPSPYAQSAQSAPQASQNPMQPFDIQTGGYLGAASNAGAFDPMGSQGIQDALARQYGQAYGTAQRGVRNGLLASGVDDPNAYAYGQLQGDLNAQGQYAGAQQNAQLQSMLQNQNWLQNMASQRQNWLYGNYQQGTQQRFNQGLQHAAQGNPWANALGQLGGSVIGAVTGGMGGGAQPVGAGQAGAVPQWNPQFGPDPYAY